MSIRREIPVTDRNDNAPKFSDSSYLISVNETAAVNTQIFNKILVTDADSESNSEVKLTCLQEVILFLAITCCLSPTSIRFIAVS